MTWKKAETAIAAALTALLLSTSFAWSEGEGLRFATMDLTPYAYKNEDGGQAGSHYEVINLILETAEMPVHNKPANPKRIVAEISANKLDCSMFVQTQFSDSKYTPVDHIGRSLELGVYPRKGLDLQSYEDLKDLVIAVPIGGKADTEFDEDETLNKLFVPDYQQSALVFQRGRVDALFGAYDSLIFNLSKVGMGKSDFGKPLVFRNSPIWVYCSKTIALEDPRLIRLREAIISLRESGAIAAIIDRSLGS